jgi:hypothetical protein
VPSHRLWQVSQGNFETCPQLRGTSAFSDEDHFNRLVLAYGRVAVHFCRSGTQIEGVNWVDSLQSAIPNRKAG